MRTRWSSTIRWVAHESGASIVNIVVAAVVIGTVRFWIGLPWLAALGLGIFAVLLVVVGLIWVRCGNQLRAARSAAEDAQELSTVLNGIVRLDASLFYALPNIASAEDREQALEKVVYEILRDCSSVIGPSLSRAYVARPADGGSLRPWVCYQVPDETKQRTVFYVGPDLLRRRGTAGEAFTRAELIVVHMRREAGQWMADHSSYVEFVKDRPHPPYRSFVAVPIGQSDGAAPLGVLCLDSMNEALFDGEHIRHLLLTIGQRLAVPILLYQCLKSLDQ